MTAPSVVAIPTFRADDGRTIQFFPVDDPVLKRSASHRVVMNGRAVDWLSAQFRPCKKSAQFFLEKHSDG